MNQTQRVHNERTQTRNLAGAERKEAGKKIRKEAEKGAGELSMGRKKRADMARCRIQQEFLIQNMVQQITATQ